MIMIDGLTAHYLIQQGSEKAVMFLQLYQALMTDILLTRQDGNVRYSAKPIEYSNKAYR